MRLLQNQTWKYPARDAGGWGIGLLPFYILAPRLLRVFGRSADQLDCPKQP